jgi:membrane protein
MMNPNRITQRLRDAVWNTDIDALPPLRARGVTALRVVHVVIRDVADGQLTLRAMSLVYTTLLSLVPLLAVSFSVLKAFGVHNQIEPMLLNLLAPLGDKGVEITSRIIGFVENIKAGLLGSMGLAVLIYTVVSLLQKTERAFNFIWHVTQNRAFAQRFSDYLSVILIGPVLVFSALGITASVMSTELMQKLAAVEPLGRLIEESGRLVPYALIIAAFTFIYVFMPNTKVRTRSAVIGAIVAGILWETTGWVFASFIVTSTKYTAIYSTFATLIMFMIWLYLSWLILLVGANIAFYHQHREFLVSERRDLRLSNRMKEQITLIVLAQIAQSFTSGRPGWSLEALSQRLHLPLDLIDPLLQTLVDRGMLTRTDSIPQSYVPARPLDQLELREVLEAVRSADEDNLMNPSRLPYEPMVQQVLERLEQSELQTLTGKTAKDLTRPEVTLVDDNRRPADG